MYELSEGEKMTRKSFENYAKKMRDAVQKLNSIEAFYAYSGFMHIADTFDFTRYAEDGGRQATVEEYIESLNNVSSEKCFFASDVFSVAVFRAIDTDGNGFITREEWSHYLKIVDTYENEEQARKSFDSLDKNKDNKISMEEYLEANRMFWDDLNEQKDLYGTKDLSGQDSTSRQH